MSQFAKGVLLGAALVLVGGMLLGLVIAVVQGSSRPGVPPDSVLIAALDGDIPEYEDITFPAALLSRGGAETPLYGQVAAIRAAAEDDRIKALVLRCDGSYAGWAKAQELRWAIQAFKESGKPVWAFMEIAGREDYYVAALADKIAIQPTSYLGLSGLRIEVTFYKGGMDKLGIEADLIRTGRYKSAGEPFSRAEMSPEWRQILNETLDEFYGQLLSGIAEGRGQDADHWQRVIDEGPFDADGALEHGLVDEVWFEDEFFAALGEAIEVEDFRRVGLSRYARSSDFGGASAGKRIALVHAAGPIVSGAGDFGPLGSPSGTLASDPFLSRLNSLREDDGIAGVILRIDSPGGDAIASEQLLRAVRRLGEEKPVVISMANVAASGGYYIAAVPDAPILAYPGTYTGSIGVFTIRLNLREMYDKLGLTKEVLSRGEFAAMDTDYRPLTEAERAKVREYVDTIYDTFIDRVAEGRGIEAEAVRELAEGRVWVGSQAEQNGLVDELGGYVRAIELVKELAEIEADEPVRLVPYPQPRTMLDMLLSRGDGSAWALLRGQGRLGGLLAAWEQIEGLAARFRNGPVLMAPFEIAVH